MYCVKCGVKLQEGTESCPLCHTPVWNPKSVTQPENGYSTLYPEKNRHGRMAGAAFITALLLAACLSCMIYCLQNEKAISWSGYVLLGSAVIYVMAVLPLWFPHPHPLVFVPLSYAAIAGYLLYICLYTGGRWFLSFAFPVCLLLCLITTVTIALYRYISGNRLFITGGVMVAIGGATMLVEFFQSITFQTSMFSWSLYAVSGFGAVGLFFLVSGMIRPLRRFVERKLFF